MHICFTRCVEQHGGTDPFTLLGGVTGLLVLIIGAAEKALKHLILCQECLIKTP